MSENGAGDTAASEATAADFARRFGEFWAAPDPELLGELLLREDVVLRAPMLPVTRSLEAGKRAFAGLFASFPDLTGEVHACGPHPDGVFIEFTLSGSAGGRTISWRAVDVFKLDEEGMARERVSYFDPMPIIAAVAKTPRAWPAFVRSRFAGRR
jgi:hypothetical protein